MKKIMVGVAGIVVLLGLGLLLFGKSQITNNQSQINHQIPITKTLTPTDYVLRTSNSRSLFIPYWSPKLSANDLKYDNYYYFGVRPTGEETLENEVGLSNIPIIEIIPQKQKKLVLRMLDPTVNEVILSSQKAQDTLTEELITVLNKNNFSGTLIDLEVPFTLQVEKKGQITQFVQQICTALNTDYKTCDVLVYGDFSYRGRPYDLKALGQAADKIILMAYDFHKAGGEPGPNYSFSEREKYGYDFKQMMVDATALVPKEKLEVVFGMYGYDWTLNEQGKPLRGAKAISLNEIRALITNHKLQITNQSQITNSKEKNIEYVDGEGLKHIIWYEDEESAEVKIEYLQNEGIGKVSFWAHGYF